MRLYELTTNLLTLWEQAADVITPDSPVDAEQQALHLRQIEAELQKLEGNHADKCLNIACLIKNLESEAEAIKAEEQKLSARRKSAERQAEWLRTYLAGNMEPGTNLKDPRAVIAWRKSSAVVVLCAPEELPKEFQRTKITVDADKTALKEALTSDPTNSELSGKAALETRFNLQIK